MAWLKTIKEDAARDSLKEFYQKHMMPKGEVDNVLKIHNLNSSSEETWYDGNGSSSKS